MKITILLLITITLGFSQTGSIKLDSLPTIAKLPARIFYTTGIVNDTMQCIILVSDKFPDMEFTPTYTRLGYVVRQKYSGFVSDYLNMVKKSLGDTVFIWDCKVWIWKKN